MLNGSAASGILFLYALDAVLLSVPVSIVIIWLYRRSIERQMRALSNTAGNVLPAPAVTQASAAHDASALSSAEHHNRWRLALVHVLAGASAAAVWTWLYFQSPGLEFGGLRAFGVWYVHCWLILPTLSILLSLRWPQSLRVLATYLVIGALAIGAWSVVPHLFSGQPGSRPVQNVASFLELFVLQSWLPWLLILTASNRRIRGISPLALASLLFFTFSSVAARELFTMLVDVRSLRTLTFALGPSGSFMLAAVPVGYICWRVLKLLNAGYRHKSFSDIQLLVDSLWFIAALAWSAYYAADFGWKAIIGMLGFVVYRAVSQIGLSVASRSPDQPGARLLILRVFGFRSRSEKLFDSIAQRWRFRGGVAMIAGADLAARTINPDDALAFLAGDLRSHFVESSEDLANRLKLLDERPDPDGRFRVAEFFCHENTWSATLQSLLARCDAVLMDLRGFSPNHCGCVFELQQLTIQRRLADTVFIVDSTTDIKLLESTLVAAGSPPLSTAPLHLEKIDSQRVYQSLCLLSANSAALSARASQ